MATVPQDRAAHVKDTIDGFAANADTSIDPIRVGVFAKLATVAGEQVYQPASATVDGHLAIGVTMARTPRPRGEPGGPEEPAILSGDIQHTGIYSMNGRAAETYKAWAYLVIDGTPGDAQSVRLYDAGAGDAFADIVGRVAPSMIAGGVLGGAFNIPVWIAPTALGRNNGVDTLLLF